MLVAALLLAGVGAARIVSTYHVFSQTYDEPATVAAGIEWLDRGTYVVDYTQPPLARVTVALLPFLEGQHLPDGGGRPPDATHARPFVFALQRWVEVGNQILYAGGRYSHNLARARLGVLPFYFLATAVVWVWSRKVFGETSALVAILLFTTLPPVLAHASLATTDMAFAATLMAALLAFIYWLECPSYARSAVLGVAAALAVLSKFSALLFLPACAFSVLACRWAVTRYEVQGAVVRRRRRATAFVLTALTACLVVWGGYRFSLGAITHKADRPHENLDLLVGPEGTLHRLAYVVAEYPRLPAPQLLMGIGTQQLHAGRGQVEYLLGQVSKKGWWYFFPVVLAVKSPLPFLILSGIGVAVLARQGWRRADWRALAPIAMAMSLLFVCMPSRINLGVRLILPIFPMLAIVAAIGTVKLWNAATPKRVGPMIVVVLLVWQLLSSARAHPDYLAYFNELGGSRPERILVDSDLDWGQDLLRLAEALRARKIDSIAVAYFGSADLSKHNLPRLQRLLPYKATTGWIAISKSELKYGEGQPPYRGYAWLESQEPVALIGRSILLYNVQSGGGDVQYRRK